MFDEFAKEKKWVPGAKYIEHSDWNLTGPKVGKWGTYKKQTFFQDIMNQQKSKPAPTTYNTFNLHEEKIKNWGLKL